MAHQHVDGTLVVAKLGRRVFGGTVYTDVTVLRDDGSHRAIGTVLALEDLNPAMVPGSRGRFYFYDVAGTKGIHGFRPVRGKAHAHFPLRWDGVAGGIGGSNLLMALGWYLIGGSFAPFAILLGLLGAVLAALFLDTRTSAMRAYRADDASAPIAAELRAAGMRV